MWLFMTFWIDPLIHEAKGKKKLADTSPYKKREGYILIFEKKIDIYFIVIIKIIEDQNGKEPQKTLYDFG